LAADYGLWAASYTRGDLPSMREYARVILADVEARPDSPEAGVAHRTAGITHWFAGEYREARDHLERALALFQPGRDDDMTLRFGPDPGVSTMAYLAFTLWPLGEIDSAISFIERMKARIAGVTHANALALGKMFAAQFALLLGEQGRMMENALELGRIARAHDLAQSHAFATFFEGWARADSDLLGGLGDLRRGAENLREQDILVFDGLVLAEEAFQSAIAVAREQGTRSFELRAALALAKLYQSTGRATDAHAVLAPALEGFSPTPEMPESAEAQALLAALADSDEVKAVAASRQRRLQLQTRYGQCHDTFK
jgi:tetratricopeptide (TPR) repeat protein